MLVLYHAYLWSDRASISDQRHMYASIAGLARCVPGLCTHTSTFYDHRRHVYHGMSPVRVWSFGHRRLSHSALITTATTSRVLCLHICGSPRWHDPERQAFIYTYIFCGPISPIIVKWTDGGNWYASASFPTTARYTAQRHVDVHRFCRHAHLAHWTALPR
jgi:hypothetical protein